MNIVDLLLGLAVVSAVWGIVVGIAVYDNLRRRGEKVNLIWIKVMMPAYVHRYSKITRAETGKTGVLFYHFVVAFNVALVAALIAAVLAG